MEPKKRSVGAAERDEWLRAAWRVTLAQRIDPQRLVFVDEMGAHTSLSPIYAYSPKGQRAYCSVPLNRGPNTTLLSCMSVEGMEASLVVEGATDRDAFEVYVERVLSPEPRPGQVVVMDNLTAHKGERGRELIEGRGCELLYLQPYSPDFNPIEEAFAEIKGLLRKAEARTRSHSRGADGGDGYSDLCGQRAGCTRLLRALRLPSTSSIAMTSAVKRCPGVKNR
jgi:transposase